MKTITVTISDGLLKELVQAYKLKCMLGKGGLDTEIISKLIKAKSGKKLYLCLIEDAQSLAEMNGCKVIPLSSNLQVSSQCKFNLTKVIVEDYGQLRLAFRTIREHNCEKCREGRQ